MTMMGSMMRIVMMFMFRHVHVLILNEVITRLLGDGVKITIIDKQLNSFNFLQAYCTEFTGKTDIHLRKIQLC